MRFAVILSGCGVRDGSEIHEAVTLLLAIDQAGHSTEIFAPDIEQTQTVDHLTGQTQTERRNVLAESARIARGRIQALSKLCPENFDAIALPGGFGAITNLCSFAMTGADCQVDATLSEKLRTAHQQGVVLAFMCIAPMLGARLFGEEHVRLTCGNDKSSAAQLQAMGAQSCLCSPDEACIDFEHRIVSTPAYMSASSISQVYASAQALVKGIEKCALSSKK